VFAREKLSVLPNELEEKLPIVAIENQGTDGR
jgi:hypothetical protein